MMKLTKNKAFLIGDYISRRYFSKVDIAEGYLVVGEKTVYFADSRYFSALKEKLSDTEITPMLFEGYDGIKEYLLSQGVTGIYLDYSVTTVNEYKEIKKFGLKVKDGKPLVDRARSVKTKSEISNIKRACKIAQTALYQVLPQITVGMTEKEVAEILEMQMVCMGAEGTSFDTIVAFGKNSAVPHHQTGETTLQENQVILIDFGCKYNGYCSDMTRTVFFGKPDGQFVERYNAVLNANILAEQNIKVGDSGIVADGYARNYLNERGLENLFTHSLGHGIGLEIHEHPYLSPKKENKLRANTVFSVEPGIYIDGEYGIRIEDTVLLTKTGVKRLMDDDKSLITLQP